MGDPSGREQICHPSHLPKSAPGDEQAGRLAVLYRDVQVLLAHGCVRVANLKSYRVYIDVTASPQFVGWQ